ncbi:hypothetical protein [Pedobacter alpinus]|uniref:hypothetical protein n=1 Tax=Pedobacter alpinus TaxID=1590643 RepID=UPI0036711A59
MQNSTLNIFSDSGNLSITAYNANIIKLTLSKEKITPDTTSTLKPVNVRVTQNLESIFFTTDSLIIAVAKFDLSIKIMNKLEKLLTENKSFFINNPKQNLLYSLEKEEVFLSVSKRGKTSKKLDDKFLFKSNKGYFLSFEKSENSKAEVINNTFSFKQNKEPISYLFFTKDLIN